MLATERKIFAKLGDSVQIDGWQHSAILYSSMANWSQPDWDGGEFCLILPSNGAEVSVDVRITGQPYPHLDHFRSRCVVSVSGSVDCRGWLYHE